MIELSIVIPVYNSAATIGRCLDSIYSEGMESSHFEVICVDDCSPDASSVSAIEEYKYEGIHPSNLILIKHTENKRPGGARNSALKVARGKWVLFIDSDDFYNKGSLTYLFDYSSKHEELDIIAFDHIVGTGKAIISKNHYKHNSTQIMSGPEYHIRNTCPAMSQNLMYKKSFLFSNNLFFVEKIWYEDLDYILKAIIFANKIVFVPIDTFYYIIHEGQCTNIGVDKTKINNLFQMCNRVAYTAIELSDKYKENRSKLLAHSAATRMAYIKRDLWRLPYKERLSVLYEVRLPFKTGNWFADFTSMHPRVTCIVLSFLNQPVVDFCIKAKRQLKKVIGRK